MTFWSKFGSTWVSGDSADPDVKNKRQQHLKATNSRAWGHGCGLAEKPCADDENPNSAMQTRLIVHYQMKRLKTGLRQNAEICPAIKASIGTLTT